MIHFPILIWVITGFAALCASRDRHQRDLFGRPLTQRQSHALRIAAWISIALSFLLAIVGVGWVLGVIIWIGYLSVGALVSVTMLNRATARRQKRK